MYYFYYYDKEKTNCSRKLKPELKWNKICLSRQIFGHKTPENKREEKSKNVFVNKFDRWKEGELYKWSTDVESVINDWMKKIIFFFYKRKGERLQWMDARVFDWIDDG